MGASTGVVMKLVSIFVSIGLVACGGDREVVATSPEPSSDVASQVDLQASLSEIEFEAELEEIEESEEYLLAMAGEEANAENEAEVGPVEPTTTIRVRAGESFVTLASCSGVTPTELAELNSLSVRDPLMAGQEIQVPVWGEELAQFDDSRDARESRRLERFIESKGGLVSVSPHAMAYGDTVWGVAVQDAGLPFWVVEQFNRDTDLNSLGIGDEIYLPILGDNVTGLEPNEGVAFADPIVEAVE